MSQVSAGLSGQARRYRVAFICIKNSCRSQMAEAFARRYAEDIIEPFSTGPEPAVALDPEAVAVMKEVGIDISSQRPKLLPMNVLASMDLVVHVGCGSERCLVVPGVISEEWRLDDCAGADRGKLRSIRTSVERETKDLAERLRSSGLAGVRPGPVTVKDFLLTSL